MAEDDYIVYLIVPVIRNPETYSNGRKPFRAFLNFEYE